VSANTHADDLKRQMEIVQHNPLTYLNVVKPYLRFNEEKDPLKHFPYAKTALHELLAMKAMVQDIADALYIYIQVDKDGGHRYCGLICTVPVDDYYNGHIRIHEKTLTEKEEQLIMHIEHSGAIGEPVLLTHVPNDAVTEVLNSMAGKGEEIMNFHDEVDRTHRLIRITEAADTETIMQAYRMAGDLYIADGHHRSAASAGYFKKHGMPHGHYLACIVPPGDLKIDSFHRAFKASGHFDPMAFLKALESEFIVTAASSSIEPKHACEFGLLLNRQWFQLHYKHSCAGLNAVDSLDVSILEEHVFKNLLHIHDSKTDKQLSFIKGSVPCQELEAEHSAGIYDAVFTVHPCNIQQVFDVADQNLIMPPKSTYIEPKLRTGLTVQLVD
jgi:uncharacterized protein (DUF1015 family)